MILKRNNERKPANSLKWPFQEPYKIHLAKMFAILPLNISEYWFKPIKNARLVFDFVKKKIGNYIKYGVLS